MANGLLRPRECVSGPSIGIARAQDRKQHKSDFKAMFATRPQLKLIISWAISNRFWQKKAFERGNNALSNGSGLAKHTKLIWVANLETQTRWVDPSKFEQTTSTQWSSTGFSLVVVFSILHLVFSFVRKNETNKKTSKKRWYLALLGPFLQISFF